MSTTKNFERARIIFITVTLITGSDKNPYHMETWDKTELFQFEESLELFQTFHW